MSFSGKRERIVDWAAPPIRRRTPTDTIPKDIASKRLLLQFMRSVLPVVYSNSGEWTWRWNSWAAFWIFVVPYERFSTQGLQIPEMPYPAPARHTE
jgi:hypothetical protein